MKLRTQNLIIFAFSLPAIVAIFYFFYEMSQNPFPSWSEAWNTFWPILITILLPILANYFLKRPDKVERMMNRKNTKGLARLIHDDKWGDKAVYALSKIADNESAQILFDDIMTSKDDSSYDYFDALSRMEKPFATKMLDELTRSQWGIVRSNANKALASQSERASNLAYFHSIMKEPDAVKINSDEIRQWILLLQGRIEMDTREDREVDRNEVQSFEAKILNSGKSVYQAGGIKSLKQAYDQILAGERIPDSQARISSALKGIWSKLDSEVSRW
jgi:hypothetical protein